MIYPEKMSMVTIVAPKTHLERVIDELYRAKVLHIKKFRPEKGLSIGEPLENAEKVSKLFLELNSLKQNLSFENGKGDFSLKEMEKTINEVSSQLKDLLEKEKEHSDRLKQLLEKKQTIEFIKSCGIRNLSVLKGYENVFLVAGQIQSTEKLKEALKGFDTIAFHSEPEKGTHNVIVFGKKPDEEKILAKLNETDFSRTELKGEWEYSDANKEMENIEKEIASVEKELSDIKKRFGKLEETYGKKLGAIEKRLIEMVRKSEAPLNFAASDFTFIITGWVPEKNTNGLVNAVKKISKGIYIRTEPDSNGPTKLNNPKPMKPFEFFINLYTLPIPKEIDPTFLLFFTFPLFYGMMLGDIGYGLVIFIFFTILRFKLNRMKSLINITILSAVFTMVFGFFFGEFFGAEQIFGYQLHPYLHRLHEMNDLILISVIFGIVHITGGFVLGFVNELKQEGIKKAILAKMSWLLIETGGILFALDMFKVMSVNIAISAGLFFLGVIMLAFGEGFIGIVELPSLLSNILSYARLAAVGLASASLAVLVNGMANGMFQSGGLFAIMGVFILIAGHTINIMLGMLDSFLQSLRLHYVEMFTKFYHGNGTLYKPFGT
ncbi:MAG: hypothetical protein DRP13_04130 [Candidatus Aenigmatarchaeota archaeon]|nr:MAG: hypothetical protein DRP13_04130 [Candidatus Aenigmarchaeota archaeon]